MFPSDQKTTGFPVQATDGPHENVEIDSPYVLTAGSRNVLPTGSKFAPSTGSRHVLTTDSWCTPTSGSHHVPTTGSRHATTTGSQHVPTTGSHHAPTTGRQYAQATGSQYAPTPASQYTQTTREPTNLRTTGCRYPDYADERQRLESYQTRGWPHPPGIQDVSKLAKYGMFYSGVDDVIRCFQCGLSMKDWSQHDDPLSEHVRFSPQCQHLASVVEPTLLQEYKIRTRSANQTVSDQESTGHNRRYRHPEYADYHRRLRTFETWSVGRAQTPNILADAGFFYTGPGDRVRCYSCDGGLQHWDTDDDPWIEHTRWFPHCIHVKTVKGDAYIQIVQAAVEGSNREDDDAERNDIMYDTKTLAKNGEWTGKESDNPIYTPAAQRVIASFGFSSAAVKMAIQECAEKGVRWSEEVLANTLLDKLERGETLPADPMRPESPVRPLVEVSTREGLLTERQSLLSRLKCSMCKENDANILFLPCAHRKICKSCCKDVLTCPVCENSINEKIETYMS